MPRTSSSSTRPTTRRSSRISNQRPYSATVRQPRPRLTPPPEIKSNTVVVEIPQRAKRGRKPLDPSSSLNDSNSLCTSEPLDKPKTHPRRSTRITPSELVRRESALEIREAECSRRAAELEEHSLSLSKKEDEASTLLSQIAIREDKAILSQLEEHFTCALCYEVMAQPYSLNPGQCGHTFCALCILRHFFSRLHKACGGWHESVDCPMCRSLLVITPDRVPRLDITFPFVPNRTAAAVCESIIEKLSRSSPSSGLVVKREESESTWPGSEWDMEWGRKKGKSKEEEEIEEENADLAGWREGGNLRTEWLKKDREGKKEMLHLLKYWTTMRSQDFVDLKQKFGV
ncbi:hypothetical protein GGX14DRAFT_648999 [Mycena pura]|uniref:RING-type domain-containing protein n=1 Tax=Mycena pura TaxID=153505 RepID=A0AAD6YMZ8_9AGAR|nr:hypothetical protein GGX14DRAFT_648999 [Mycena pura]